MLQEPQHFKFIFLTTSVVFHGPHASHVLDITVCELLV
jgi:hypothetical protein